MPTQIFQPSGQPALLPGKDSYHVEFTRSKTRLKSRVGGRRYDPYARVMTRETYDHDGMRAVRRRAVEAAARCKRWGLVLGTLGRQGNPAILEQLQTLLREKGLESTLVRFA